MGDAVPVLAARTVDGAAVQLNTGSCRKVFATLHQVHGRRDTCPFCGLVYRAVQRYSGARVMAELELFLTWEVDGRQTTDDGQVINRTRRIRVSWKDLNGKEENVYLVLIAPKGARKINSDAHAMLATDTHFLGRGLRERPETQALMKSWVDLCVDKHGPKCQNKHGSRRAFRNLIKSTYFGVIDVIDMQLKPLPIVDGEPERYVALSYVWGQRSAGEKPYTTTRANIMTHIQHGGLETAWGKLPRTIQEAILLVSRLGERYIWIDSLCIVQDSTSSWELNAKSMHLVYGNAHFTICAADGDAEAGLRAVSPLLRMFKSGSRPKRSSAGFSSSPPAVSPAHHHPRPPSPIPSSRLGHRSNHGMHTDEARGGPRPPEEVASLPLRAECLPGVRLLVLRPPESVIQQSVWNQRGWTFQERLLSRRCLIFAEGQVFFQCKSTVMSQQIFTDGGVNGWSLDWTNSPLRTLGELQRRAFWFYMKCVPLYTGRDLTKPKDILTAFQGTAWLLQQRMNAPLFYGLPSSHFDLALLWTPRGRLDRRMHRRSHRTSTSPCSQDEMGNCNCKVEEEGYGGKEFPSWSWCGWAGGQAEYTSGMIDGCLMNVQEWLRDHTWIRWYVRDREGNLRPLWDKDMISEDRSEEARWRGYAGRSSKSPEVVVIRERRLHSPPRRRISSPPIPYDPRRPGGPPPPPPQPPYNHVPPRPGGPPHLQPHHFQHPPADPRARHRAAYQNAWSWQPNTVYLDHMPPEVYEEEECLDERVRHSRARNVRQRYYPEVDMLQSALSDSSNDESGDDSTEIEEGSESSSETQVQIHRKEDNFGRPIRPSLRNRKATEFTGILPDHPFSIIRGPFPEEYKGSIHAMPILQFWTWRTELLVTIRRQSRTSPAPESGLCQCDVIDRAGDWCGSIVLPQDWIGDHEGKLLQFIAISDAKSLTRDECPVWNYYIPKEEEESEWDLYYVMLLKRNRERALWERVAIGKVFQAAFGNAVWDEIKLG